MKLNSFTEIQIVKAFKCLENRHMSNNRYRDQEFCVSTSLLNSVSFLSQQMEDFETRRKAFMKELWGDVTLFDMIGSRGGSESTPPTSNPQSATPYFYYTTTSVDATEGVFTVTSHKVYYADVFKGLSLFNYLNNDYRPYYQLGGNVDGWLDKTSRFRTGADLISTMFGGAAEQTILETKTKSMFSLRNASNPTSEIQMTRALGATRTIARHLGRTLGIVSACEHYNLAVDAYKARQYGDMFLNAGKTAFDGFLILNKSTNPLWIVVSIGYTAFDLYTSKP